MQSELVETIYKNVSQQKDHKVFPGQEVPRYKVFPYEKLYKSHQNSHKNNARFSSIKSSHVKRFPGLVNFMNSYTKISHWTNLKGFTATIHFYMDKLYHFIICMWPINCSFSVPQFLLFIFRCCNRCLHFKYSFQNLVAVDDNVL